MTAIPMHDHDHELDHDHDHEHEHHEHGDRQAMLQLWFKALLMIAMGFYLIYNIATGNILNYINVRFAWLTYVAAALFLIIGVFSVWHLLRDHGHDEHGHDHADHHHEPISWGVLALLSVPLLLGVLVPSQPLGASAVSGGSLTSAAATVGTTQDFNVPPEQRTVLDWLRAFNGGGDYSQFSGQNADVIGFVYTEPTFDKDEFMVARFAITCCVADAMAIGLPVYSDKSASLPQGQWIEVKGTFNVGTFNGQQMPVLQAASIDQVEQPAHPYLYP